MSRAIMEKKITGKNSEVNKNAHIESEVLDAQSKNNGVATPHFNNEERNLETFEDFADFHDQELYQLHKLTAWEERCLEFSTNVTLPLRQKRRLSCPIENNDMGQDKSYIIESLASFSPPTGHLNGESRHSEITNSAENKKTSQSYTRFKNHQRKERKSSLINTSVLPPLVEEKYNSRPSPVIKRHPIGEFGERNNFDVPAIVLSTAEDEHRDKDTVLRLPKIESAASMKSGHLQIPLSSSEPNVLAPPGFLEPFKAFRPPVQPRLDDKNTTVGTVRLPQLRTRDSATNICDNNEKELDLKQVSL